MQQGSTPAPPQCRAPTPPTPAAPAAAVCAQLDRLSCSIPDCAAAYDRYRRAASADEFDRVVGCYMAARSCDEADECAYACGADGGPVTLHPLGDASTDVTRDATRDAAQDATRTQRDRRDAETATQDTATDATQDVTQDTATDAPSDATQDAAADAALDATQDAAADAASDDVSDATSDDVSDATERGRGLIGVRWRRVAVLLVVLLMGTAWMFAIGLSDPGLRRG